MKVELGDEVKDSVTGFKGIVVAMTDYIHGCTRISVQPKTNKDGKMPDQGHFDVMAVKVVKKSAVKRFNNHTGGPGKPVPTH